MSDDQKFSRMVAGLMGLAAALLAIGTLAFVVALGGTTTHIAVQHVATPVAMSHVNWVMKSDDEHGRKGPDGKWHDAMIPGNPVVHAGQVTVTVLNYDDMAHTVTAPGLNVATTIPGGQDTRPGRAIIHFTARRGVYQWFCAIPCDPFSMTRNGYMRGNIIVE